MISAHKVLLASVAALMLMASAPYILLADTGEGSTSEDPVEVEPYFSQRYDGGALPLYKEDIVMNGIPMTVVGDRGILRGEGLHRMVQTRDQRKGGPV